MCLVFNRAGDKGYKWCLGENEWMWEIKNFFSHFSGVVNEMSQGGGLLMDMVYVQTFELKIDMDKI